MGTYKIRNEQVMEIVQAWRVREWCSSFASTFDQGLPRGTGTNQIYPLGSPISWAMKFPTADMTGMGQKDSPYPQDRI